MGEKRANAKTAQAVRRECEQMSEVMKSLSHPTRLLILCLLLRQESTVTELTKHCKISQSSMSQFLARMKEEGLLKSRREGNFIYYGVSDKRVGKLLNTIKKIYF